MFRAWLFHRVFPACQLWKQCLFWRFEPLSPEKIMKKILIDLQIYQNRRISKPWIWLFTFPSIFSGQLFFASHAGRKRFRDLKMALLGDFGVSEFWSFSNTSQSSKLTDVSHHKGELSFVSKLRLQLMYDLPELGHKICGIIFHSENSNIITYQRSRSNSFFAFKVMDSSRGLSRKIREMFAKNLRSVREVFGKCFWSVREWKVLEKFAKSSWQISKELRFLDFSRIFYKF